MNTNPARGMRDFLPADIRKRNYVINIIKEVYESYGFEPLETPSVENLETLTGKYGDEGNQLMFKILKRGEKLDASKGESELSDLALRYDLTVPLARVVANHRNELPKFFKRYQIQPVWRADRPARGRFREFYQCDVDAIGSKSMVVEAELISAVCEILPRLGFKDFQVRLNHRNFLDATMEISLIPKEKFSTVLGILDKLDKIGKDGIKNELLKLNIPENNVETILARLTNKQFLSSNGKLEFHKFSHDNFKANLEYIGFLFSSFKDYSQDNTAKIKAHDVLGNLESLVYLSEDLPCKNYIQIDPSLARGLSYYTGAIFEIVLTNGDFAGSIGGGGRYDGLIGMFGKEQIPAVGFSLGLERILLIMEERGMFAADLQTNSADVMVTIWNEEAISESLKLAGELRKSGLRVFVYPEADKLGKQFKYADSINIPYVCVLGDEELKQNKVALKNLKSGEQEILSRDQIASKISS
jgi:histidyl-tRNA synthetase